MAKYYKGKYCIWENLPQVHGVELNEHAYFSLIENLKVYFAFDFQCAYLPDYVEFQEWYTQKSGIYVHNCDIVAAKNLSEMKNVIGSGYLHVSGQMWHDDMDPSGSNKKTKNNVWVFTFSIKKQKDHPHSSNNTFVISLGKKGINHDCVFEHIKEEIEIINGPDKWFYCKKLGGSIQLYIDISIDLADSPEFHDCNHISRGNSTYTSLRGWVFDLSQVWDKFKSCDHCFKAMMNNDGNWSNHYCCNCVNWDISNDPFGMMKFLPPKAYPKSDSCLDNDGFLYPKALSNDSLKSALDLVHKKVRTSQ